MSIICNQIQRRQSQVHYETLLVATQEFLICVFVPQILFSHNKYIIIDFNPL